jgi:hypothetical protein
MEYLRPAAWHLGRFLHAGQGDCVPINLFGESSPPPAAIDWVMPLKNYQFL